MEKWINDFINIRLAYIIIAIVIVIIYIIIKFYKKCKMYSAIRSIIRRYPSDDLKEEKLANEIKLLYDGLIKEKMSCINSKKYFNCILWIDYILIQINKNALLASALKRSYNSLKSAKDILVKEAPFSNCAPNQQRILRDISKLSDASNQEAVESAAKRVEDEFLRQEREISKNTLLSIISLVIGVCGFALNIYAFVKDIM